MVKWVMKWSRCQYDYRIYNMIINLLIICQIGTNCLLKSFVLQIATMSIVFANFPSCCSGSFLSNVANVCFRSVFANANRKKESAVDSWNAMFLKKIRLCDEKINDLLLLMLLHLLVQLLLDLHLLYLLLLRLRPRWSNRILSEL